MSSFLVNYTTQIGVPKTMGEITAILASAGATAIMQKFGPDREPSAISFRISTKYGLMSFCLPADVAGVMEILKKKKIPQKLKTKEQASRVTWRVIKAWLEAQVSLVNAGMCRIEEVFLPYAQNHEGETLVHKLRSGGFSGLALPPSR